MKGMKVAFIGHRTIADEKAVAERLRKVVKALIKDGADEFLFGSKSRFNDICYEVVTELKHEFRYIRRIYVRAEYEFAPQWYINELLSHYESTLYPDCVHNAGVKSYIKRNRFMIDKCDTVVVYYDKNYEPSHGNSGTMLAVTFAERKNKRVINVF